MSEAPTKLRRRVAGAAPQMMLGPHGLVPVFPEQEMLQAHQPPDDMPFVCLQGVREYHDHPAHSGDSWLLHRGKGEGTLYFILEKLYHYGVEPLKAYHMGLEIKILGLQGEALE